MPFDATCELRYGSLPFATTDMGGREKKKKRAKRKSLRTERKSYGKEEKRGERGGRATPTLQLTIATMFNGSVAGYSYRGPLNLMI